MRREILVTGCAGFIGFHVSKRLLEEGFQVIGVDNMNDYYDVRLKEDRLSLINNYDQFIFYQLDLSKADDVNQVFKAHNIEVVVNLAAQAGVRHSIDHPMDYIDANIVGFLNILEASRHYKVAHLLYASSSSVYGSNKEMPFSTKQRVDEPLSLYAATKCANELMAHTYSHLFRLPTTGLRFFTVYGPWGRPDMALFKFTKAILNEEPIEIYNEGKMKRDFTYVDDIVEGIFRLLFQIPDEEQVREKASLAPAYVYNIGNNRPTELMDFISLIETKVGKKAKRKYLPLQPGDVPETYADITPLNEKVGFQPSTSIEEGINHFVDWYLDYYGNKAKKLGIVGLGYVGLPVAAAFASKEDVVGFDISESRIDQLKNGYDATGEMTEEELASSQIEFTTDPEKLKECNFIIVTVPTPIDEANQPNLNPLRSASETVGKALTKGTTVVYESTVYPGVTEEVCLPILEEKSGLAGGKDFHIGYSPERINPGDANHSFESIVKVVAGESPKITEEIARRYQTVVQEVFPAASIKVAEAAKVIENTQRDLNIALMNELALIFDRIGICTKDVLEAAGTKWNFHKYTPGLVGGHCIGVDPYYLVYKAESIGYHPQVIQAGRRINDDMAEFIAHSLIKLMINQDIKVNQACVTILGATFKENVPDIRNSKVTDVIRALKEFGLQIQLHDPLADPEQVKEEFGMELTEEINNLKEADALVYAVPHQYYAEQEDRFFEKLLKENKGIIIDVKSELAEKNISDCIHIWGL
ncbi:nucleotide sugar dehydrogenase [Halobacillus halophilus]|uniref:nucleotide sugar dehydrogenase n=1 Tax=Halobacillus halophilus TaxID=1570 RepID=UPI00296E6122|nr:nucleotide sugar dehydrogenase [Halobacillus halophilus]